MSTNGTFRFPRRDVVATADGSTRGLVPLLWLLASTACGAGGSEARPSAGESDSASTNERTSTSTSTATPATEDPEPATGPVASNPENVGDNAFVVGDEPVTTEPGPLGENETCAGVTLEPREIDVEVSELVTREVEVELLSPVAFYVVLDNSGSMINGALLGEDRWSTAVEAISAFVGDPGSVGVEIGLQYFNPVGAAFSDPGVCDGSLHREPAVAMGALPANASPIVNSLNTVRVVGTTPTSGALLGGIQFCESFATANPEKPCAVLLVTDGNPDGCGLNASRDTGIDPASTEVLTELAADGLSGGVRTFTVGMDGVTAEGFDLLDAIASSGGSDCNPNVPGSEACNVSTTGVQGFIDSLNSIRDSVTVTQTVTETVTTTEVRTETLGCQWELPEPADGSTLDPLRVNVDLTPASGATTRVGALSDESECEAAVDGGWFYDDPEAPASISVCTETCDLISSDPTTHVSIQAGCETERARIIR